MTDNTATALEFKTMKDAIQAQQAGALPLYTPFTVPATHEGYHVYVEYVGKDGKQGLAIKPRYTDKEHCSAASLAAAFKTLAQAQAFADKERLDVQDKRNGQWEWGAGTLNPARTRPSKGGARNGRVTTMSLEMAELRDKLAAAEAALAKLRK